MIYAKILFYIVRIFSLLFIFKIYFVHIFRINFQYMIMNFLGDGCVVIIVSISLYSGREVSCYRGVMSLMRLSCNLHVWICKTKMEDYREIVIAGCRTSIIISGNSIFIFIKSICGSCDIYVCNIIWYYHQISTTKTKYSLIRDPYNN